MTETTTAAQRLDPALTFWRTLFQRWRESDELWRKITQPTDNGEQEPRR